MASENLKTARWKRWYVVLVANHARKEFSPVELIAEAVVGIMIPNSALMLHYVHADDLRGLIFLELGGVISLPLLMFIIRCCLAPAKLHWELQEKLEIFESKTIEVNALLPKKLSFKDHSLYAVEIIVQNGQQAINDVTVKILKIEPPLSIGEWSSDTHLENVAFNLLASPDNSLNPGEKSAIHLFTIERSNGRELRIADQHGKNSINWTFGFPLKNSEYVLTIEASAVEVPAQQTKFKMVICADDPNSPPFSIEKIEEILQLKVEEIIPKKASEKRKFTRFIPVTAAIILLVCVVAFAIFKSSKHPLDKIIPATELKPPFVTQQIVKSETKPLAIKFRPDQPPTYNSNSAYYKIKREVGETNAAVQKSESESVTNYWRDALIYYAPTISALRDLLAEKAGHEKDAIEKSDGYDECLPAMISPEIIGKNLGEIRFSKNTNMDFTISIRGDSSEQRPLVITCSSGLLEIHPHDNLIHRTIHTFGLTQDDAPEPLAQSKDYINEGISALIDGQWASLQSTNK